MRDAAGQCAHRFHFLRLAQLRFERITRRLGLLARRHVRHRGEHARGCRARAGVERLRGGRQPQIAAVWPRIPHHLVRVQFSGAQGHLRRALLQRNSGAVFSDYLRITHDGAPAAHLRQVKGFALTLVLRPHYRRQLGCLGQTAHRMLFKHPRKLAVDVHGLLNCHALTRCPSQIAVSQTATVSASENAITPPPAPGIRYTSARGRRSAMPLAP